MAAHHLTLLQINDTHAYLEPHPEVFWGPEGPTFRVAGGVARIAGLVHRIGEETGHRSLLLDCGDTLHGTGPAQMSRGEVMVPVLNALGIGAMTAHWDFAFGPERLRELGRRLDYPILAVNCFEEGSNRRPFEGSVLLDIGGLQVGVIGCAATILDKTMPPSFSAGLRFTTGKEELPGEIRSLRERGAGLIVVLSHLGLPQDIRLASEIGGIDVLLSGHTHHRLRSPIRTNGTLIIQSGAHGSFLGRLDLTVDEGGIRGFSHRLLPVDERCPVDPTVSSLVEEAVSPFRSTLGRVVGSTAYPLYRGEMFSSGMDTFLLEAIRGVTGTELVFSNGWRYGTPILPGPITTGDLHSIIPMNPEVMTITLTGAELHEMIEENIERTFSCDPYGQMGGYLKRCLGMTCYLKLENPPGHRIQDCWIGTRRLDPSGRYRAAFVTVQGVPGRFGTGRAGTGISAHQAMEKMLVERSPYRPTDGVPFRVI